MCVSRQMCQALTQRQVLGTQLWMRHTQDLPQVTVSSSIQSWEGLQPPSTQLRHPQGSPCLLEESNWENGMRPGAGRLEILGLAVGD